VYILDTNVVSELRKAKPHGAVIAWIRGIDRERLFVSAVTFGELQAGIELTREQDAARAVEISAWVDMLSNSFRILPMEAATFQIWATLLHRKPHQLAQDGMIAATAIVHGMAVATRNVSDFAHFDVPTVNPFSDLRRGA
jgi:toxin FitB